MGRSERMKEVRAWGGRKGMRRCGHGDEVRAWGGGDGTGRT